MSSSSRSETNGSPSATTTPLAIRRLTPTEHLAWIQHTAGSVSFLQTPAWGKVKADWRSESLGWFSGDDLVGTGLVLYRPIPRTPWSLAYVPEGPSAPWVDGHPLARKPALLRRAAAEIVRVRPDADADDVVLWAEARLAASE